MEVFGNLQKRKKNPEHDLQTAQSNMNSNQACTLEKEIRQNLERL